jgi:hypothetical protein
MVTTTTVINLAKRVSPYGVDLTTATINCALFTSTATITAASTLYSGLTNEVANGNGYATGGKTITGLAWSGTTTPQITGTIPNWTSATFTFRYAVIYDTDTSKIIEFCDFEINQSVVSGTIALSFGANGMIQVSST